MIKHRKISRVFLSLTILLFSLTGIQSCKKRTEVDSETGTSKDNAASDKSFSKVNTRVVSISIKEEGVNKFGLNSMTCATVTTTTDTIYPKQMTIDFGSGCLESDGMIYKGKIVVQLSAKWITTGAVITYQLSEFSINGIALNGTVQITNNGNYSYSTVVTGGTCNVAGSGIEYACEKTYKWISGMNTDTIPGDDVYEVTGSTVGKSRDGKSYITVTLVPLRLEAGCKWVTKGIVSVNPSGADIRTLDYGLGDCDSKASVTINGSNFDISLE